MTEEILDELSTMLPLDADDFSVPAFVEGRPGAYKRESPTARSTLFAWSAAALHQLRFNETGVNFVLLRVMPLLRAGIALKTDYSGVGTPEVAMANVEDSLRRQGCDIGRGFWASSACEADQWCRKMLSHHVGASRPLCIFGDLMEFAPESSMSEVKRMLAMYQQARDERLAQGESRRTVMNELGRRFMKDASELVLRDTTDFAPGSVKSWCFTCGRKCSPYPLPEPGVTYMAVAGVTCYDWSGMGSRNGWLAESSLTFLSWARLRLICKEPIIVVECVPQFDDSIFAVVFGGCYQLTSFVFGPDDLGFPAQRRRKYMVLLRVGELTWHPVLRSDPVKAFKSMFYTKSVLPGSILLAAPKEFVDAEILRRAKARYLPDGRLDGRKWSFRHVLSSATRKHLSMWKNYVRESMRIDPRARPDILVQSTQTPHFQGRFCSMCPPLLRNSRPWSMAKQRYMLDEEKFEAQGFSVFCEKDDPFRAPFVDFLLSSDLTRRAKSSMAGNGMHVQAVGCIMVFALACSVPAEQHGQPQS